MDWRALLCSLVFASSAAATPAEFARSNNFLTATRVPGSGLGSLVRVNSHDSDPSLLQLVCTSQQMGIIQSARYDILEDHQEVVGLGEQPISGLAEIMFDINEARNADALIILGVEIKNIEVHSINIGRLPLSLSELSQDCLVRLSNAMHDDRSRMNSFVIINKTLLADVVVRTRWDSREISWSDQVAEMSALGDLFGFNGGIVTARHIDAKWQRIGWQHDGGSWLRSIALN